MKAFTKKLLVLCALLVLTLGLGLFAACGDKDDGDTYTITVTILNPDGTPNTGAQVQICEVEDNGELVVCWSPEKVNAQGVSVQKTHNLKPVEVHVMNIDGYKYDPVRLDKDHTEATITLYPDDGLETYTVTVAVAGGLAISELPFVPKVLLTNANDGTDYTEEVNAQGIATFRVPEAAYIYELTELAEGYSSTFGEFRGTSRSGTITLTATASTVRLKINFGDSAVEDNLLEKLREKGWEITVQLSRAGKPVGNRVEVKFQPQVDFVSGYYYAEVTANTGTYSVDYYLTLLDVGTEYKGTTYNGEDDAGEIEISPSAAQTAPLELHPTFNVVAAQVPDVQPQAPENAVFVDYPLDGTAGQQFVFDDNHIMHIGTVSGPVVYAAVGKENRLFGEVAFDKTEVPASDWAIYDRSETSSTKGIRFNYFFDFIQRYVNACENGLTAVTEELYTLLRSKVAALGGYTATGERVDADCYGLVPCGYFSPVMPNSGVAGDGGAGSAANPYAIRPLVGTFRITIPAGSAGVYYAVGTTETMQISSSSEKAKITYAAGSADSTANGNFSVVTAGKVSSATWDGSGIVFLLGSTDSAETTYEITVRTAPGSRANPYEFGNISETGTVVTKSITLTETDLGNGHGAYYRITVSETGTYAIWTTSADAKITLPDGETAYTGSDGFAFIYSFTGTSALFMFGTESGSAASYTVSAVRILSPFGGVGEGTADRPHEIGIGAYFADNVNSVYVSPTNDGTHYVLNPKFTGTYMFTLSGAPDGLTVTGADAAGSANVFTVSATAGEPVHIVFAAGTAAVFNVSVTLENKNSIIWNPMNDQNAGTEGAPHELHGYNSFTVPADKSQAGVWFSYTAESDGTYSFSFVTTLTAGGTVSATSTARAIYGGRTYSAGNPVVFEAILSEGETAVFRLEWNLPITEATTAGAIYVDLLSVVRTGDIPELTGNVITLGEVSEITEAGDSVEWYFKADAAGWYVVRSIGTSSVYINEIRWGGASYTGVGGYLFYVNAKETTTFYVTNSGAATIRVDSLEAMKEDAKELTEGANKNADWTTFTYSASEWNNAGVLIKFTVRYNTEYTTYIEGQTLRVDGNAVGGLYLKATALIGRSVTAGTAQNKTSLITQSMTVGEEVYLLVGVSENVTVNSSVSFRLRAYPYGD